MDEREERIARNEALFRHINERLEDLNDAFASMTQSFEVVCECGAIDCTDQVRLTTAEYERVRADPTLFIICVGHVAPDVEDVVGAEAGYEIVRKHAGEAARLARELDERSP